jgi:hypothetical protein
MPVNKGLLISAAIANGLQGFLDAREKGDLQRQRKALADVEEQMATVRLENLKQTGEFQAMKIEDYPEQQESSRQLRQTQAETALVRAQNQGKPDDKPLTPRQKTIQQIFAGADLLQRKDESDADYGKRLIEYPDSPGANPFVSQTIYEHINLNSADFSNFLTTYQGREGVLDLAIKGHRISGLAQDFNYNQQRTRALLLDNQARQQKINDREMLTSDERLKLLDVFAGYPGVAEQLSSIETHDQLDNFLGNSDIISLVLQPGTDFFFSKGEDGSVTAIDKNDISGNHVQVAPPMKGGGDLSLDDRFKIHDAEVKERNAWNQRPTTRIWREVKGQYNAATNVIRRYNTTKFGTEDQKVKFQQHLDAVLTNLFRKLIDPRSVVRNSEFNWVTDNQAKLERFWAYFEAVEAGGVYTDNTRQGLASAINEVINGIGQEYIDQYNFEADTAIPKKNKRLRGGRDLPAEFRLETQVILGDKPQPFSESGMIIGPIESSAKKPPAATTGGATATTAQEKLAEVLKSQGIGLSGRKKK